MGSLVVMLADRTRALACGRCQHLLTLNTRNPGGCVTCAYIYGRFCEVGHPKTPQELDQLYEQAGLDRAGRPIEGEEPKMTTRGKMVVLAAMWAATAAVLIAMAVAAAGCQPVDSQPVPIKTVTVEWTDTGE